MKTHYIPTLDGLRALSIIAVLVFHAEPKLLLSGYFGVDVFFALSGFLITTILLNEIEKNGRINFKNFYIKRILRLFPALVAMLSVFLVYSYLFLNPVKAYSNFIDSVISFFYLSNWARAFKIHPPDYLGHTWSLSIEEQFYLIWPLALIYICNKVKTKKALLFTVLSLVFVSWGIRIYLAMNGATIERLYNGLDTRFDTILLGAGLAVLLSGWKIKDNQFLFPIGLISLIGLGYFASTVYWRSLDLYYWKSFAVAVLSCALIASLVLCQKNVLWGFLFGNRFMVGIGKISYGLYLWHFPIFRLLLSYKYTGLETLTYGSLITVIISVVSYFVIERPFLKLKSAYHG